MSMAQIETNFTLEPIFTMTIDLEPNGQGMLIIQRTLVTETQYNRLLRSFKLGTDKHQGETPYGITEFNGFRMEATVSSEHLLDRYLEMFLEMINELVLVGMKKDKDDIPVPRTDLLPAMEKGHLKVFVDKGISTAFLGGFDIPDRDVLELDKVDTLSLLGSIVDINKNNIKTNFGNELWDEEDEEGQDN